jgi:hypothetical protein
MRQVEYRLLQTATAAPKKITIRPVYGRMVHMLTAQEIVGDTEVAEIDGWLQAQIDAGKIVVVE